MTQKQLAERLLVAGHMTAQQLGVGRLGLQRPHGPDSAGPGWPATGQPDPCRTAPETNASNLLPLPASGGSLVNQIST